MDNALNVTYITLAGYVEVEKYRYVYFVIMFTVYVLIICSNSTIVYLIVTQQSLHEPMYVFIAALLVNSVLFSTVVYPKLLIDFLSDKQLISYSACHFQSFIFYSLGGSDFLLLAAMAFDRYVSICKPLQYPIIMRKTNVLLVLGLAWFLPAFQIAISVALRINRKLCHLTLKGIFCNNSLYNLECESSAELSLFGLFMMFNILVLPVLFILFTYSRILIISYRSCREVRKKAAQTCLPHLLVLINFTYLCIYDVIIALVDTHFSKTVSLIMTLQVVLYNPLFNPIIYGLKMKEIYKHLKRLFCSGKKKTLKY